MNSQDLIKALKEDGKVLIKIHHRDQIEYLFYECEKYGIRGWGTAFGTVSDRLASLITQPEEWNILEDYHISQGYPYPWSTKFSK